MYGCLQCVYISCTQYILKPYINTQYKVTHSANIIIYKQLKPISLHYVNIYGYVVDNIQIQWANILCSIMFIIIIMLLYIMHINVHLICFVIMCRAIALVGLCTQSKMCVYPLEHKHPFFAYMQNALNIQQVNNTLTLCGEVQK